MDIIADTGPILSFARSHRLDLLQRVVGVLIIPQAVYEELVIHSSGKPGANEVRAASWILRQAVKDPVFVGQLPQRLHLGEREAIGLARECGAVLLVDEREARREAQRYGIAVMGSLRVLKAAKNMGLIAQAKAELDALMITGLYISDTLYHAFLADVDEA